MIKIIIIIKINIFTFRVIRIGEIIFSAKVYHISSLNIVFHSLSKYLSSPLIYIYIFRSPVCGSLQFSLSGIVSHVHVLSRERRAIYQKTRGNNSRHTKCKHTGEVHQSEVFPTLVPPFSPRFTYLRHSIFPNVCVCE